MKAYCKKCKKITIFKKAPLGVRCTLCYELEYDSFVAQGEISKKKFIKYESRVKAMSIDEGGVQC